MPAEECEDLYGDVEAASDAIGTAQSVLEEAWDDWEVQMGIWAVACGGAAWEGFANPIVDLACAAETAAALEGKGDVEEAEAELAAAEEAFDEALGALNSCLECYHSSDDA